MQTPFASAVIGQNHVAPQLSAARSFYEFKNTIAIPYRITGWDIDSLQDEDRTHSLAYRRYRTDIYEMNIAYNRNFTVSFGISRLSRYADCDQ